MRPGNLRLTRARHALILEGGGDWPLRIQQTFMRHNPSEEPDFVFDLRMKCATRTSQLDYIPWQQLAEARPDRAIQLLGVHSGHILQRSIENLRRHSIEMDGHDDAKALVRAAILQPRRAWRCVGHALESFFRTRLRKIRDWRSSVDRDPGESIYSMRASPVLVAVGRVALSSLARRDPAGFLRLAGRLSRIRSRTMQRILVDAYANLPTEYADRAINWLLALGPRLRCGSGRRVPRWVPARHWIERMSPHCSNPVLAVLERWLLSYRDPREKRLARSWLSSTRYGWFRNEFGAARHFLLPGLCPGRRSLETTSRIGVLQRKFDSYPKDFFVRPRPQGGIVLSPLSRRRIDRIGDEAWLRIMANRKITSEGRMRFSRKRVVETSVDMLARDLRFVANRDPERFGHLGLRIPDKTPSDYVAAILDAVGRVQPSSEVPEPERAGWKMASAETVQRLLHQSGLDLADGHVASQFCWVLMQRTDFDVSPTVLDRLVRCAGHADPAPDALYVNCDQSAFECSVEILEQNAINSVRAVSAHAMSRLLYSHPESYSDLRIAIDTLLNDPNPAVRVAAIGICQQVWFLDRRVAVNGFLQACHSDCRVAACHSAAEFFNLAFTEFGNELVPLLRQMTAPAIEEVADAGAMQVAGRFLLQNLFETEFANCLSGSSAQRKGVVRALRSLMESSDRSAACSRHLSSFFSDPSESVRQEASRALYGDGLLTTPDLQVFLQSFVQSEAFRDDPIRLIHFLEGQKPSLRQFSNIVMRISDEFASHFGPGASALTQRISYASTHLTPLLLRLYDENPGDEVGSVRQCCLDAWDRLLEARVGPALTLTRALDV